MIHICQSHAADKSQIIRSVPIALGREVAQEIVVYSLAVVIVHSILPAIVPVPKIVATTTVVKFESEGVVG